MGGVQAASLLIGLVLGTQPLMAGAAAKQRMSGSEAVLYTSLAELKPAAETHACSNVAAVLCLSVVPFFHAPPA